MNDLVTRSNAEVVQIAFGSTEMRDEGLKCNSVSERHIKWAFQVMECGDGGGCPGSDRGCCVGTK